MADGMDNDFQQIRGWLADLPPLPAHVAGKAPDVADIYAPAAHESALDPDRILVVGGRGVGKSFWAAALLDRATRAEVASRYVKLKLDKCEVALGFAEGDKLSSASGPSADVIGELIEKDGFRPETIWRAVLLHALRAQIALAMPDKWRGTDGLVAWVDADAERAQSQLLAADQKLTAQGLRQLIVFDGLDRLAETWADIRVRSKGLLRVALAVQGYRAIKLKIFMRTDQAEDSALWDFPDASKLSGGKVDLGWERRDLYGLLFSLLANHGPTRPAFLRLLEERCGQPQAQMHGRLKGDEGLQETIFTVLAGQYMGSDRRRGKTYGWLHNHLADAFGKVSPRTFLAAVGAAAKRAARAGDKVIEPKGLQFGVQEASSIRVAQLSEDFFWIRETLEPLVGLQVPCPEQGLFVRWQEAGTVPAIAAFAIEKRVLAPVEFDAVRGVSEKSLLDALMRLGVAERRPDGRINVPDIYRVAARLLKKGGLRASG